MRKWQDRLISGNIRCHNPGHFLAGPPRNGGSRRIRDPMGNRKTILLFRQDGKPRGVRIRSFVRIRVVVQFARLLQRPLHLDFNSLQQSARLKNAAQLGPGGLRKDTPQAGVSGPTMGMPVTAPTRVSSFECDVYRRGLTGGSSSGAGCARKITCAA